VLSGEFADGGMVVMLFGEGEGDLVEVIAYA
jgi:hypothetical protein